jgi:hypothetical protein
MDPTPWYETYQEGIATALSAFIGFAGVILTIRSNATQTRKLDQERTEQAERSIRAAIRAELSTIQEVLSRRIQYIERLSPGDSATISLRHSYIETYRSSHNQIGFLDNDTLDKVMKAYAAWKEMNDDIFLSLPPHVGYNLQYLPLEFMVVGHPVAGQVVSMMRTVREKIADALTCLGDRS